MNIRLVIVPLICCVIFPITTLAQKKMVKASCYEQSIESLETVASKTYDIGSLVSEKNYNSDELIMRIKPELDATFQLKTFKNGSVCFPNRPHITLMDVPNEFEGFDYLANNATVYDKGVISVSKSGYIYAFAYPGSEANMKQAGWERENVKTFGFWDKRVRTELCIYKKYVEVGSETSVPAIINFAGCTPLARKIIILPTAIRETASIKTPSRNGIEVSVKAASDATFQVKSFQNGSVCFPNRPHITLMDIPEEFKDFDYLANNATIQDKGVITVSESGYIYAFAYPGNETNMKREGWEIENVKTFGFWDGKVRTELCIYKKYAKVGTEIPVPSIINFAGCTPIAKKIILLPASK